VSSLLHWLLKIGKMRFAVLIACVCIGIGVSKVNESDAEELLLGILSSLTRRVVAEILHWGCTSSRKILDLTPQMP
jgi:hypothetical protein